MLIKPGTTLRFAQDRAGAKGSPDTLVLQSPSSAYSIARSGSSLFVTLVGEERRACYSRV
jgi:hypothetical protein